MNKVHCYQFVPLRVEYTAYFASASWLCCLLVSYRPLARYVAGLVKPSVCRGDEVTAREQLLEESFVATLDRCNAPSSRRVLLWHWEREEAQLLA